MNKFLSQTHMRVRLNITNSFIKYVKLKNKNKEFGRDIAQIMTSVRSITMIIKDELWAKISSYLWGRPLQLCCTTKIWKHLPLSIYGNGRACERVLQSCVTILNALIGATYTEIMEKEMATHSSILAWKTPWTEEPGRYSLWGHKELDTTEHEQTCMLKWNYLGNWDKIIFGVITAAEFSYQYSFKVRNELPVYFRCRIQDAWGWCTGMIQRDDMGWEAGWGSGLGACIHPWQIHVNAWQNQYSIVK